MDKRAGSIGWRDLTVENADQVRDFYSNVVGWKSEGCDMGGYQDYSMLRADDGECMGGICHARGANAGMPAQWLIYINVDNLDASLEACKAGGGEQVGDIRSMGADRFCVIKDPAGAHCALYEHGKKEDDA